MMLQGIALGAVAAVIGILTLTAGFCINDNLNVRAEFADYKGTVETANKESERRKIAKEKEYEKITADSDKKYELTVANYDARLSIMHDDRLRRLNEQFPQLGKEAFGLPPICFSYDEYNTAQRESEQETDRLSQQGEINRLRIEAAKDWADRQTWEEDPRLEEKEED